jgi:phosphatidylinositol alpha-mannosyltransferase
MRIALVSPYSWTYPGGVTRHIEALAQQFLVGGHEVRVLAPYDADDRLARRLHRGARPEPRPLPDYVVPLGRTVGFHANGAVSNVAITPRAVGTLRRELRAGDFDVIHVHEPIVPMVGWDAVGVTRVPVVGTFHAYSTNVVSNTAANFVGAWRRLNHLHVRIAVSEAAAWTGRRWFGGHYRVIPNGVDICGAARAALATGRPLAPFPGEQPPAVADIARERITDERPLRIVFVGQAVERKGLPVLLRAFEALREHIPATLTVIGADHEQIAPMLLDEHGIEALGKVGDVEKSRRLQEADVLCAPSLGGESFGMVLTEAFAAGTPVVASEIPGYVDVVRDGVDGVLVPRGDPVALAEALRDLALEPRRRIAMAAAAAQHAQRYAWPRVAGEVLDAYGDAIATPQPQRALHRSAVALGVLPADLAPLVPPRRLVSLERERRSPRERALAAVRRVALTAAALGALALAFVALERIGFYKIAASLIQSQPSWVLLGLGLMCAAMFVRGIAWHAIMRAALPRVRRRDAMQGTFIGVLMSATLPARLGELSRSLIVARRLGRARETLPIVLGTIMSQTLLNLVALGLLGIAMFSSVNIFDGHHNTLLLSALAPVAVVLLLLTIPTLLSRRRSRACAGKLSIVGQLRAALARARDGLSVFRQPRLAAVAVVAQLGAWGLQMLSCYVLLIALGLDTQAGITAAAAVLFAVNVTAVLPAAPSNLGVFQAACVVVLHGAYHVSSADALAYGIILQAVEIATAIVMGGPALLKEGLSWREVRVRAVHAAPVKLPARPPLQAGVEGN